MSRIISIEDNNSVRLVLNEPSEYVLDSTEVDAEGLTDIIYADGTRAILVNGQIIQKDGQTVVLQEGENLNQYYINDENGEILIADDQDTTASQSLDGTEIIQYVDEDGNALEDPQVIYVNEEGFAIQDTDLSQYQLAETQGNENILKAVKLETQVVDLDELISQQADGDSAIMENFNEENGYQYAILKDGKLHIQTYNGDVYPVTTKEIMEDDKKEEQVVDLSKITGVNLLTGQTVSLHGYIDKIQKKLKSGITPASSNKSVGNIASDRKRKMKESDGLKSLLNKKLHLGRTVNGKRLVGKVVHVEKKGKIDSVKQKNISDEQGSSQENTENEGLQGDNSIEPENIHDYSLKLEDDSMCINSDKNLESIFEKHSQASASKKKVIIQKKVVSKDCFDHISRTLSGLMNMDSIKKKLQYKNIIVKVVEKVYMPSTKTYSKNISYSSGYMEEEYAIDDAGEMLQNWNFVPDSDIKGKLGVEENDNNEEEEEENKYLETTSLTIMITQEENNEKVTRVTLNSTSATRCPICWRECRSNLKLRAHMNDTHTVKGGSKICEICGAQFDNFADLQEHRSSHVNEGKLFRCLTRGCGKFFSAVWRLKRHSAVHNTELLECTVCHQKCSSESALKKHILKHVDPKPYSCETCGRSFTNLLDCNFHKRVHTYFACEFCKRTFSRYSNLQRHIEIHKENGNNYQCAICSCSYHYMSSLTRHIVQNHVKRVDNDIEVFTDESNQT